MARSKLMLVALLVVFTVVGHLIAALRSEGPGPGGRALLIEKTEKTCDTTFDTHGGFVLYLFGILYMLFGLAVICEGDFKRSLVEISKGLNLSEDIAGATFMAAGTSSPELFTALIAVWSPKDDIGVGTIVGSAIFNIWIIVGMSAILSNRIFSLDWRPILRDSIVNVGALIYLLWVFNDGAIKWYEAATGVLVYIAYVALMSINKYIMSGMSWTMRKITQGKYGHEGSAVKGASKPLVPVHMIQSMDDTLADRADFNVDAERYAAVDELVGDYDQEDGPIISDDEEEAQPIEVDSDLGLIADGRVVMSINEEPPQRIVDVDESKDTGIDDEDHHKPPETAIEWTWATIILPYEVVFSYTIPPAKGKFKYQYMGTFLMSLLWLAALTYFMVDWTETVGCILQIDDSVMGVTFLAIGTSMPDCLTSIAVAKTGRGNMAVCNALGSNVFDIFLALTLPWCLSLLLFQETVKVSNDSLTEYVLILFIALCVFFLALCFTKFKLSWPVGAVYSGLYCIFFVYAILKELDFISLL